MDTEGTRSILVLIGIVGGVLGYATDFWFKLREHRLADELNRLTAEQNRILTAQVGSGEAMTAPPQGVPARSKLRWLPQAGMGAFLLLALTVSLYDLADRHSGQNRSNVVPRTLKVEQINNLASVFRNHEPKHKLDAYFCCSKECEDYQASFDIAIGWEQGQRVRVPNYEATLPRDGAVHFYANDTKLCERMNRRFDDPRFPIKAHCDPASQWPMYDGISEVMGFEAGGSTGE